MTASQLTSALLALRETPKGNYTGAELCDLMGVSPSHAGKFIQQALRHGLIAKTGDTVKCPQRREMVPVYAVPEQPKYTGEEYYAATVNVADSANARMVKALKEQEADLTETHNAAQAIYAAQAKAAEDITARFQWASALMMLLLLAAGVWIGVQYRAQGIEMEAASAKYARELQAWGELYHATAASMDSLHFHAGTPEAYDRVHVLLKGYHEGEGWRSAENGMAVEGVEGWRR